MKYLLLLSVGIYVAYRMEKRIQSRKGIVPNEQKADEKSAAESYIDETLEESFPASDPPNYSSTGYHH